MARNAVAAKKAKERKIDPDELAPGLASGLTQGVSAKEALEEHPVDPRPSGIEIARDFSAAQEAAASNPRERSVHFIARLDPDTKLTEPNTGREMIDADVILPEEHRRQILAGYRCINCYERFETPWPTLCDVCGFEVADRQILRAAHEFEGDVHVGPKKPINEFLAEKDVAQEKRIFDQKIQAGKSRMTGLN